MIEMFELYLADLITSDGAGGGMIAKGVVVSCNYEAIDIGE